MSMGRNWKAVIMVGMVSDFSGKTYLDYAASTPVAEEVMAAMLPFFTNRFGNPSSTHSFGQSAEAGIERARATVAELLNCTPQEVIFTSGGTESNNLAIRGTALARREKTGADHILISPVEHPAAATTAQQLADMFGFELELLPVDETGRVSPQAVQERLRPSTALVSIIYGNNEIGTINPIQQIARVCREAEIPLHTDAVQAAAHLSIDVAELGVSLLSIGAHKFYGPKGVGALFISKGTPILPTQTGGSHESGLRAGTSNTPLIVGLAKALETTRASLPKVNPALISLRDQLIQSILQTVPDSLLTGHARERLPNHASFAFRHVDGNELSMLLDAHGFACSSGSACKSGSPEPSRTLLAMGLTHEWALGSIRVSLGRATEPADVDRFVQTLPLLVEAARRLGATA